MIEKLIDFQFSGEKCCDAVTMAMNWMIEGTNKSFFCLEIKKFGMNFQ